MASKEKLAQLHYEKDFSWCIDKDSDVMISCQDSLDFDESWINEANGTLLSKLSDQKCELRLSFGEQTVKVKEIRFIGQSKHVELHINNQYIGTFRGKELANFSGVFDVNMEFACQLASTVQLKVC